MTGWLSLVSGHRPVSWRSGWNRRLSKNSLSLCGLAASWAIGFLSLNLGHAPPAVLLSSLLSADSELLILCKHVRQFLTVNFLASLSFIGSVSLENPDEYNSHKLNMWPCDADVPIQHEGAFAGPALHISRCLEGNLS